MLINKVDRRYAKSLLDFSEETGRTEEVKKDVESVLAVIDDSKEFKNLLKSPVISIDKKERVIEAIFGDSLSDITTNYFKIIARRGREGDLEGILRGFIDLYRKKNGIETAMITVAKPLTEAQRAEVKKRLAEVSGNEILITEIVEPKMIGGIKIRLGDKEYNGSIAAQLDKLKRKFESNAFVATF